MLPFTKMQGVGNDFVVVAESDWPLDTDWTKATLRLCDRKFGVGSDGLLVVGPSEVANLRMSMFNPDGTEDMCGNGLRCAIRFACEKGFAPVSGHAEAIDGVHLYDFQFDYKMQMPPPHFDASEIPMLVSGTVADYPLEVGGEIIPIWAISTGTTHTIIFVDELPDDTRFFKLSPLIEHHPLFPQRTSVMWAVVEKPGRLRLRIWERGAGETLGCGTGACAAAIVALSRWPHFAEGLIAVEVVSKGGSLFVAQETLNSSIWLTGPAEFVYDGVIDINA